MRSEPNDRRDLTAAAVSIENSAKVDAVNDGSSVDDRAGPDLDGSPKRQGLSGQPTSNLKLLHRPAARVRIIIIRGLRAR